jgi:hypothetical protein
MLYRTIFLYAAMGLVAGAAPALSSARARRAMEITPIVAAQARIVPVSGAGYVWAPAYHGELGLEHIWVGGDYLRERLDDHWVADRWYQRGNRWHHEHGGWDRD